MLGRHTGSRHIGPETQSGNIDHQIIRREIVQNIPLLVSLLPENMKTHLCFAREYHVTRYGHQQTTEQRHGSRNVCYCVKPIQRWGREGFVDKDGIMVAHELSLVHGQAVG